MLHSVSSFLCTQAPHTQTSLFCCLINILVNKWNEKPCVVGCAANLFELRPTLVVSNVPRLAYVTSRAAAHVASPIGRPKSFLRCNVCTLQRLPRSDLV